MEKPLHIHRILLQRSWVDILRGRFDAAAEKAAEARELLDSWPRHSWLQYARLDDHLGSILRAEALADPANAAAKLEQAADLKVPAALAVDSVRHAIVDADARMRWATLVSARILAGAFAVAWEWGNTELLSELVEYHSARGTFSTEPTDSAGEQWMGTATAAVPVEPTTSTRWWPRGRRRRRRRRADPARPAAAAADGPRHAADHEPLSRTGVSAIRPRHHRRRGRLVDVAVTDPSADPGPALRRRRRRHVRQPARRRTAVADGHLGGRGADSGCGTGELARALPDPHGSETQRDAVRTRDRHGPVRVAVRRAGDRPRPGLATARRARVAAVDRLRGVAARSAVRLAERAAGPGAVGCLAMPGDDGYRLMELVDVLMAAPPNIVNAPRTPVDWDEQRRAVRRCWSSIRGCRASGPTRRSARCSAGRRRKHRWRAISAS